MTDFSLVLRNLTRKPLRLGLTLFAIFMAFLILTVLIAFQLGFDRAVEATSEERLVTISKINFTVNLPIGHVSKIRATEHVEQVAYADWFGGYFKEPSEPLVMFAVSPEAYLELYDELIMDDDARAAFLQNKQAMVMGEGLMREYGFKVGDRVPMRSNIFQHRDGGNTWELDLVGTFRADDPAVDTRYIIFHHDNFNESRTFGRDTVGWVIIKADNPANNDAVMAAIDAQFANSPNETSTSTEKAFQRAFVAQIGNIGLIIMSVVGAALFVILMIVGNAMMMAIRERTGEIAVFKALGFRSGRIFAMVLGESLMLSLIGGLAGLAVGAVLVGVAASAIPPLAFMVVSTEVMVVTLAVMLALGVVTGFFPARTAMNTTIITAFQKH